MTDLNAAGITVISWAREYEVFGGTQGYYATIKDAEVMFDWILNDQNAQTYDLDNNNIVVAGQSLGSLSCWKLAFSGHPSIKGINLIQNIINFNSSNYFSFKYDITENSPPILLNNKNNIGEDPTHDVAKAMGIVERYEELGIGDKATLYYNLWEKYNPKRTLGSEIDQYNKILLTPLYWSIDDFVWSVVDSEPFDSDNLFENFEGWNQRYQWEELSSSSWSINNKGEYQQNDLNSEQTSFVGNDQWSNYSFTATARTLKSLNNSDSSMVANLAFRVTDQDNMYLLRLERNGELVLDSVLDGQHYNISTYSTTSNPTDDHIFKVEIKNKNIKIYLNGELTIDTIDDQHINGKIGLTTNHATAQFDDIAVIVESKILFSDNYDNGFNIDQHEILSGDWSVSSYGYLINENNNAIITMGNNKWDDYIISTVSRTYDQQDDRSNWQVSRILFRYTDENNYYEAFIKRDRSFHFFSVVDGIRTKILNLRRTGLNPMHRQSYSISVKGSEISFISRNGNKTIVENNDHQKGKVGFKTVKCKVEVDYLLVKEIK